MAEITGAHSVRRHLRVEIEAYDATIRKWVPGYEEAIDTAARAIAAVHPRRVVDLGAGTGALSEAVLRHAPEAVVELVDADAEMLEQARARLHAFRDRIVLREARFTDPFPSCDAVTASLALHHVPTLPEKGDLFGRIHGALRGGGVFANVDIVMPADPDASRAAYGEWAEWMAEQGIPESRAYELFAEWADEDTYLPAESEREALLAAGFEVAWPWRMTPLLVSVATKPERPPRSSR